MGTAGGTYPIESTNGWMKMDAPMPPKRTIPRPACHRAGSSLRKFPLRTRVVHHGIRNADGGHWSETQDSGHRSLYSYGGGGSTRRAGGRAKHPYIGGWIPCVIVCLHPRQPLMQVIIGLCRPDTARFPFAPSHKLRTLRDWMARAEFEGDSEGSWKLVPFRLNRVVPITWVLI